MLFSYSDGEQRLHKMFYTLSERGAGHLIPTSGRPGGNPFFRNGTLGSSQEVSEDFTLQDNLTKIVGRHTLKTGYEVIRTRFNSLIEALPSGFYRMSGTDFPFAPAGTSGNDFAAFLLGTVIRADFTKSVATWLPRWWSHALYVQDDFKPTRSLTLNVGLRWS
jgi:outer membrane receptor protein involved in Fe transport